MPRRSGAGESKASRRILPDRGTQCKVHWLRARFAGALGFLFFSLALLLISSTITLAQETAGDESAGAETAAPAAPPNSAAGDSSLSEQIRDFLEKVAQIGSYKVATIEGTDLTIGAITIALILLFLGYFLSRRISRLAGKILARRFGVDTGHASAIETLGFYLLFVLFTVTALRLVHFPLTAFTFLGGALAIGIGFGSQNLMNNFISGLLLMIERPVRVGDLVEVEGTYGTVEHIGARSTRVLASNRTHIIVPNSFFLQTNVINFTLSDDVIRAQVNVGIAYGSDTRKAEEIITSILKLNEKVLTNPLPRIIFAEFGDNALHFEIYFWTNAHTIMERRTVESQIRFLIDDQFREAGVVIAFPQRDVHLDSLSPIEVKVLDRDQSTPQGSV